MKTLTKIALTAAAQLLLVLGAPCHTKAPVPAPAACLVDAVRWLQDTGEKSDAVLEKREQVLTMCSMQAIDYRLHGGEINGAMVHEFSLFIQAAGILESRKTKAQPVPPTVPVELAV